MRTIPYGRQCIDRSDVAKVIDVLRSDWLTQGPKVAEFEDALKRYCAAKYAVAVSSGTAALHIACLAAGLKKGDEAITSPVTFVATANAIIYSGAKPVFADIDYRTFNIDPDEIAKRINDNTKAILPVHFAGLPCKMNDICRVAQRRGLFIIEDACHSLGAQYKHRGRWVKVGSCADSDMTVFSFHPVKTITTGEGGAITTNDSALYKKLLALRSHGIYKDSKMSKDSGSWFYEMRELGFNYRITDMQCALGLSQLKRIDKFLDRRREVCGIYNSRLAELSGKIELPYDSTDVEHAHHLYVIRINFKECGCSRKTLVENLRRSGIFTQVHYIPVYKQPYYKNRYNIGSRHFPNSEKYYEAALSLPLYPGIKNSEVDYVVRALKKELS